MSQGEYHSFSTAPTMFCIILVRMTHDIVAKLIVAFGKAVRDPHKDSTIAMNKLDQAISACCKRLR